MLFTTLNEVYSVSGDCTNVIQFALGLGLPNKRPGIWNALQVDCCDTNNTDVTCTSQTVTKIDWVYMGLDGIIIESVIPTGLTILNLDNNQLTGTLPKTLPSGLTSLSLWNNKLTGTIPPILTLNRLTDLYLESNQMSGDLPAFPSSLQTLYIGNNHFTGDLRLNRPLYLHIENNWITEITLQQSGKLTTSCNLSYNPLLGNPNIANLTMCRQNGLYSASLLPNTLTVVSNKTTALSSATAIYGTLVFKPLSVSFVIELGTLIRCVVDAMLLSGIFLKTPFKREIKRMANKNNPKDMSSSLDL